MDILTVKKSGVTGKKYRPAAWHLLFRSFKAVLLKLLNPSPSMCSRYLNFNYGSDNYTSTNILGPKQTYFDTFVDSGTRQRLLAIIDSVCMCIRHFSRFPDRVFA